ncbi:MAG: hypothetical protein Q4G54_12570 [Pelistega sp.]|nr:hypothetical protein [Pelistega sp.]
MDLKELIEQDEYKAFLVDLDKLLPVKIDYKARLIPAYFELFERLLSYANASSKDILYVIRNHKNAAIRYIIDTKEEMSKEPLEEGVVEILPPNIIIPIGALIEFYIFDQNGDLNDYMKKMRMPGAKKYIKQLTEIFNTAMAETKGLDDDTK